MVRLSKKFFYLSILPTFMIFLCLVIYPTFKVITLSFTNFKLTRPGASSFVGFDQFIQAFSDPRFNWAIGRSIYFALLSVLITLVLGYLIASLLHRDDLRGIGFFRVVILIPMLVTPLVVGQIFRFMFDYENGILNYLLNLIGLPKIPFLASPEWAIHSAIIVDVWQWTPFAAIVLLAGMSAMPNEPLEASSLDGANFWQTLFSIKLPLLRPIIGVIVLIRFMDAFREFDKLYILTTGGPGTASETLSIYIWRQAFQYFNTGYSAATGLVMLIIVNIVSVYYVRISKTLD
jgi:multiple sugar transport system permease protein